MRDRHHNLVVRVDGDEMAKLHRLADDRDETISAMVRRFLRDAYAARFGNEPAPAPKLKFSPRTPASRPRAARVPRRRETSKAAKP